MKTRYYLFGILPCERIANDAIVASSLKVAKSKMRRRYKGLRDIMVERIEAVKEVVA